MSNAALVLLVVLAFAAGLAIGWHARGWHDGSTITAASADAQTQDAVDAGASAAVAIAGAQSVTERAVSRVEYVTRTVTVDRGCLPGAGPVSDALSQELRESLR